MRQRKLQLFHGVHDDRFEFPGRRIKNRSHGDRYMTKDNEKLLVIHNFGGTAMLLPLTDKIEKVLFVNGEAQQNTDSDSYTLKLGGYASVVFKLGN